MKILAMIIMALIGLAASAKIITDAICEMKEFPDEAEANCTESSTAYSFYLGHCIEYSACQDNIVVSYPGNSFKDIDDCINSCRRPQQ